MSRESCKIDPKSLQIIVIVIIIIIIIIMTIIKPFV